jgi:hypothetical protein
MRNFKFVVAIETEKGKTETNFKSFRDISESLNIDYHIARELNRMTENKVMKKFTHDNMKELFTKIKIYTIKPNIKI